MNINIFVISFFIFPAIIGMEINENIYDKTTSKINEVLKDLKKLEKEDKETNKRQNAISQKLSDIKPQLFDIDWKASEKKYEQLTLRNGVNFNFRLFLFLLMHSRDSDKHKKIILRQFIVLKSD